MGVRLISCRFIGMIVRRIWGILSGIFNRRWRLLGDDLFGLQRYVAALPFSLSHPRSFLSLSFFFYMALALTFVDVYADVRG